MPAAAPGTSDAGASTVRSADTVPANGSTTASTGSGIHAQSGEDTAAPTRARSSAHRGTRTRRSRDANPPPNARANPDASTRTATRPGPAAAASARVNVNATPCPPNRDATSAPRASTDTFAGTSTGRGARGTCAPVTAIPGSVTGVDTRAGAAAVPRRDSDTTEPGTATSPSETGIATVPLALPGHTGEDTLAAGIDRTGAGTAATGLASTGTSGAGTPSEPTACAEGTPGPGENSDSVNAAATDPATAADIRQLPPRRPDNPACRPPAT